MSETDTQNSAALLPESSVAVYSTDKETLEAARLLPDDWRFARVTLAVEEGDVDTAIAAYEDLKSPDLIIVQTDVIDESFTDKLGDLAENCDEGTAAVVVGPVNDVYLYRQLIDMGVSDYLVKPVDADMFSKVISKALIEKIGVTGSRLIATIGAKGGVGTSTLSAAMGWGISGVLEQKLILVDASGGWSSHAVGIGFEPASTLAEAARAASNGDEDSLARMIYKASDKFSVLSSGGDVLLEEPIDKENLEVLLDALMVKYPIVLVDLSGASSELKKIVCSKANKIVITATPVLASLRLARSLLQEVKDVRGGSADGVHMVINKQGFSPNFELAKGDIKNVLDIAPDMVLPFDTKIFVGIESEDRNIIGDKDGKGILDKHIVPFLRGALGLGVVQDDAPVTSDKPSGGLFGGILGRLGSKG